MGFGVVEENESVPFFIWEIVGAGGPARGTEGAFGVLWRGARG